jgi:hypothetical protein
MKVKAVPTFHFYSRNKVIDRFVGAKEEKVKELIQKNSRRGSRKSSAAPKVASECIIYKERFY